MNVAAQRPDGSAARRDTPHAVAMTTAIRTTSRFIEILQRVRLPWRPSSAEHALRFLAYQLSAEAFRARELPELVVRRQCLSIRADGLPRFRQRLRIADGNAIFKDPGAGEANPLTDRHRVAVRSK